MAMANETVTLLRSARIPGFGWRRGKAIIGKTGKVVPDYMLIGKGEDRELHHPLARSCQLRPAGFGLGFCSNPRISFLSNPTIAPSDWRTDYTPGIRERLTKAEGTS